MGFQRRLEHHGIKIVGDYSSARTCSDLKQELKAWFSECKEGDVSLIMLADKDIDTYATIKRIGDFHFGQHTICATKKTLSSKNIDQTYSNLAAKLNMKMGGINYHVSPTKLGAVLGADRKTRTIILGADVTHPGAGSKLGMPSIVCLVGSVDASFMKYLGSMRLQAGGQEHIENCHMESMVEERVRAWKENNQNTFPTSLVFYRDGVSESQFERCLEEETIAIRKGYTKAGGTGDLSITYIVVGKRHNTRFYARRPEDTYTEEKREYRNGSMVKVGTFLNGNLRPGLLVDDVVTLPGYENFYLQSHCAIKGTARSAHYHILTDEMKLGKQNVAELSMLMCYAFGRATTGVSYAAPAYMADRLCEYGRAYLRPWMKDKTRAPLFNNLEKKDTDGNIIKPTKEEILNEKRRVAHEIVRDQDIWGPNYDDKPGKREARLNPWRQNLD
ncbi:Piwi-domain-containing protein, partial [Corynespora cassiicola Philippines]